MRKNFDDILTVYSDGTIEPKVKIRIGGVEFGPGVRIGSGVSFGGVDLSSYIGRDFEVESQGDVYVLKGIY